jgi:hypothetical protein
MNEQLIGLVDKLAVKLGVAVEILWAALIKQAYVSNIVNLVAFFILAAISIWGFKFVSNKTKDGGEWDNLDSGGIAWLFWGAYTIVIALIICLNLSGTVSGIINPEYWALKEILGAVK